MAFAAPARVESPATVVPETLLWKDAHRRRRASLPCGVKLLEGTGRTSSLPDTVGEEGSSIGSPSDSTSTELCDDDEVKEIPDLPADPTKVCLDGSGSDVHSSSSEVYECSSNVLEQSIGKDKFQTKSGDSVFHNSVHPSETQHDIHPSTVPEKPLVGFDSKKQKNSFRTDEVINVINEVKARKRSKEMSDIILVSQHKRDEDESVSSNLTDAAQLTLESSVLCEAPSKLASSDAENQDTRDMTNSNTFPGKQEYREKVAVDLTLDPDHALEDPAHELENVEPICENDGVLDRSECLPALPELKAVIELADDSNQKDNIGREKNEASTTSSEKRILTDSDAVPLTKHIMVSNLDFIKTNYKVNATKKFDDGTNNDVSEARESLTADLKNISSLEVKENTALILPVSQSEGISKKSPSLSELSQESENSPCKSDFKSGLTPMSTSLSEAWANLANLSLESPKLTQQSPITLSRSSSISKRSRSSSSISPRSPRISLYEDDSSIFELCKEAESIRQYIDSEFLSNLLLKGEREKIEKIKSKKPQTCETKSSNEKIISAEPSPIDKKPTTEGLSNHLKEKFSVDVTNFTSLETTNDNTKSTTDLVKPSQNTNVLENNPTHEESLVQEGETRNEDYSYKVPSSLDITTQSTVIKVDGHEIDTVNLERNRFVPTLKAKSDPNSPQGRHINSLTDLGEYPPTHLHPLSSQDLGLMDAVSPAGSPSPSPTFSKSSFVLNSQFLKSLSVSTQELLNSLVVSSSLDLDEPLSPKMDESVSQKELQESKDIELALPTLAPSTSRAICKLFNAAGELSPSQNVKSLKISLENIHLLNDIQVDTSTTSKDESWKGNTLQNGWARELNGQVQEHLPSIGGEIPCENFVHGAVDEDILRHEKALDEILAPNSLDEMPLVYSQAPQSLQSSRHKDNHREVPTLQELASASLPSAHPVSSAIISFNPDDHRTVERTHLNRRFNSPEFRNTQSPRLSLRDKFERDFRSKPRAKHSKSLSKNARFQKGPKSRVNSQENVEKSNKLDKSKSESRLGESANKISDEYPSDEKIRSDGSLECKKQTTVKFASLNIEIPHYREPEIEEPPLDDRSSDVEDFMSPSDEITAEMIRKRLWAGLRSFSVDVDILQAYGILTNSGESFQSNLLCSLSEHPTNENEVELQKVGPNPLRKTSMTAEDVEFLETRRNTKRRGSVAALQELVKENTLVIERILKQKKSDKENRKINSSEERLAATETSEAENNGIDKKTSRLLDEAILRTSQDIRGRLLSMESKSSESAATPSPVKHVEPVSNVASGDLGSKSEKEKCQVVGQPQTDYIGNENAEPNQSPVLKLENENEVMFSTIGYEGGSKISNVSKNEFMTAHSSMVTLKSETSVETTLLPEVSKSILEKDHRKDESFNRLGKSLVVTQREGGEDDSRCFKLPLSAFCVSSSASQTRVTDSDSIVPLSANPIIDDPKLKTSLGNTAIVSKDPDSPCRSDLDDIVRFNSAQDLAKSRTQHNTTVGMECAKRENFSSEEGKQKIEERPAISTSSDVGHSLETNKTYSSPQTVEDCSSNEFGARRIRSILPKTSPTRKQEEPADAMSSKSSEESSCVSTVSDDSSSRQSSTSSSSQKLYLPLSPSKTKSLISVVPHSDRRSPSWSKVPSPSSEPNIESRNRPITFNPFPPRTTSLHRKEVSLKLGVEKACSLRSGRAEEACPSRSGRAEEACPSRSGRAEEACPSRSGRAEEACPSRSGRAEEACPSRSRRAEEAFFPEVEEQKKLVTPEVGEQKKMVLLEVEEACSPRSGRAEEACSPRSGRAEEACSPRSGRAKEACPAPAQPTTDSCNQH
ncbi:hypothetical protein FHG87_003440 [Trinorchestia longiramus]|nr:hypothetical protein FHG87_003440 [Trinorchestia longiramus]